MAVPALPAPGYRPCGLPLVPLTSSYIHSRADMEMPVRSPAMQAVTAPVPGPLAACAAAAGGMDLDAGI